MSENILTIRNLRTYYYAGRRVIPAADGVDLTLGKGEVLGIVGESGCGKSTVARSVIGLIDRRNTEIAGGSVIFEGQDLLKMSRKEMNGIRGHRISMIFQNPLTSLDPVYTIESQISEMLKAHFRLTKEELHARCIELMEMVGIPAPEARLRDYPHQLSGGMQQRVLIAIALACNPQLIIADEPTTALDVTIQAQILQLIRSISRKQGLSMLLITHNMGIIAQMCDRIMVMYGGVCVEEGSVEQVFRSPRHPYTQGLLKAIPSIASDAESLYSIAGSIPRFSYPVSCCRFSSRCPYSCSECLESEPELADIGEGRRARCFRLDRRDE